MTAGDAPQDGLAEVIGAHVYGEFLGGLGEVWTTCACGARINATFGGGKSSGEVFAASWGAHVAEQVRAHLADETTDEPERQVCGRFNPDRSYPYRCTKPNGHDGSHGYAGVFWDADPPQDACTCDSRRPHWHAEASR